MTESKFYNKLDYCKEGHLFCHEHTGKMNAEKYLEKKDKTSEGGV